jgi:hypothetical protein
VARTNLDEASERQAMVMVMVMVMVLVLGD